MYGLYDSFRNAKYRRHIIPINETKKHIWDIREYGNGMARVGGYVVRVSNSIKCAELLGQIDGYIKCIKEMLEKAISRGMRKEYYSYATILVITPCTIQEMTPNTKFDGLNKPYDIVGLDIPDGLEFKQDTLIRAKRRHIMLTLFRKNGTRRPWKEIKKLLLHEMSHTMCNHVTYREEGNHMEDFREAEKFLTDFVNSDPIVRKYEQDNFIALK